MPAAPSPAALLRRLGAGALLALAASGCGPRLEPTRGILLVSLDTLRADRLGCYGHRRDTSPFLDSLAARGVLFERLISQYPSTLTSHMSIFTGLYPREHGVLPPRGQLAETIPTLPELLRRAGFRTAGFTEAGQMRGRYGFARGFEVFDDQARNRSDDVERTLGRGLEFLRALEDGDRFFVFLHTYAIHTPYDPPPPYDTMFWDAERPEVFAPTGPNLVAASARRATVGPVALDYFRALYDGSIRQVDDHLRQFFGELEALGLAEDLTVIVTSDHGEEFLEHGQFVHAQVYHETVHVPLIVVHPGLRSARRVPHLVETVDLAPTVLELAGLAPAAMSGRSLAPWISGAAPAPRGYAHSEVGAAAGIRTRSLHRDAAHGQFQLVHTPLERAGARERITHFDIGPSALDLGLASFLGQPRRVEVRIDGKLHETLDLDGSDEARVQIPADPLLARRRIRIEADSCTPRHRRGQQIDCFSLLLSAPGELQRLELFELAGDPLAQHDVWSSQPALGRKMLRELNALRWDARAAPGDLELDDEAQRQLEALGYF